MHTSSEEHTPDSILVLHLYDEWKSKDLRTLKKLDQTVRGISHDDLKQMCGSNVMYTPKQCKATFLRQIKVLMDRFNKTTSESEGGEEFREDIRQLDVDMQQVIDAGIVGIHEVRFKRVSRK